MMSSLDRKRRGHETEMCRTGRLAACLGWDLLDDEVEAIAMKIITTQDLATREAQRSVANH
jgi:hypothetical protein